MNLMKCLKIMGVGNINRQYVWIAAYEGQKQEGEFWSMFLSTLRTSLGDWVLVMVSQKASQ